MRTLAEATARRHGGLTLVEFAIALAVLAILAAASAPSLAGLLARQRVNAAAHTLAAHLSEARFEAVRRGQPVYLSFHGAGTAGPWCYALALVPKLDCRLPQSVALRVVQHSQHRGVLLAEAQDSGFDASNGSLLKPGGAQWRSARGDLLNVRLTPLGRASVCGPAGAVGTSPAC